MPNELWESLACLDNCDGNMILVDRLTNYLRVTQENFSQGVLKEESVDLIVFIIKLTIIDNGS